MNWIVDYIYSGLEDHERNIKFIWENLCRQTKFNRKTRALALGLFIYVIAMESRIQDQNKKIKLLSMKVEELESWEGD